MISGPTITTPNANELEAEAALFRRAILAIEPKNRLATLFWFPLGACDHTSLLLGAYLFDRGFGRFDLVGGELMPTDEYSVEEAEITKHVWLQQGLLIIDITSDQFGEPQGVNLKGPAKVVVGPETHWHRRFKKENFGLADFRNSTLVGRTAAFDKMYELLLKSLRKLSFGGTDLDERLL